MNSIRYRLILPILLFTLVIHQTGITSDNISTENTSEALVMTAQNPAQKAINEFTVNLESEDEAFALKMSQNQEEFKKLQSSSRQLMLNYANVKNNEINDAYDNVTTAWSSTVDHLFSLFSDINLDSNLSAPPNIVLSSALETEKNELLAYQESLALAKAKQKLLIVERTKVLDSLKVQNFKLMQDLGILRTKLLQLCDHADCHTLMQLNERNLGVLIREIRIVPLKFIAGGLSKWIEIRSKILAGLDGWIDLTRQVFFLFLLLLIPFLLTKTFRWISSRLDQVKNNLLSKSIIEYRSRTSLSFWIARLNPFIPSAGMIFSIYIARLLIVNTDLRELAGLLFYIQFFFVYRFVRQLLMIGLEFVFNVNTILNLITDKLRIAKSATRIARLVFIEYLLLYIIEDTVRKALAYHLFSSLIFWVNLVFIFVEANNWASEICSSFSTRFPKAWGKLQSTIESRLRFFLLPILFVAVVFSDLLRALYIYLSRVDFVKRMLSEFLKNRLQKIEKEEFIATPPTQEYLKHFDYFKVADTNSYISQHNSTAAQSSETISEWVHNKSSSDLLLIVGNRGMGKSTILNHLAKEFSVKSPIKQIQVKPKVLSQEELYRWLSELFNTPINSIHDFQMFDQQLSDKHVIFVDDIQNFFIGIVGGLSGYKAFLEVVNLKTKNVFWCLSINSRSWSFLKGLLGSEHFYGSILTIKHWKDFEIKNLILNRHNLSDYELRFDTSVEAYGVGGSLGDKAEALFFRLLWGQSRGNPRSALMYWVSAISCPNKREIFVGIPSFVNSHVVAALSDDALFLLSAIAKHENLTPEELKKITNIETTVIRKCLKEAEDKQLIWQDEFSRLRISSRAQYIVDYFLIGKNFLYE